MVYHFSSHPLAKDRKNAVVAAIMSTLRNFGLPIYFLTDWDNWKSPEKTEFGPRYSDWNTQTYAQSCIDIPSIYLPVFDL